MSVLSLIPIIGKAIDRGLGVIDKLVKDKDLAEHGAASRPTDPGAAKPDPDYTGRSERRVAAKELEAHAYDGGDFHCRKQLCDRPLHWVVFA